MIFSFYIIHQAMVNCSIVNNIRLSIRIHYIQITLKYIILKYIFYFHFSNVCKIVLIFHNGFPDFHYVIRSRCVFKVMQNALKGLDWCQKSVKLFGCTYFLCLSSVHYIFQQSICYFKSCFSLSAQEIGKLSSFPQQLFLGLEGNLWLHFLWMGVQTYIHC